MQKHFIRFSVLILTIFCVIGSVQAYADEYYSCYTVNGYTDVDGQYHGDPVLCIYKDDTRGLPQPNNNNTIIFFAFEYIQTSSSFCKPGMYGYAVCDIVDGVLREYIDLDNPIHSTPDGWFYYGIDTSWRFRHPFWDNDDLWTVISVR